MLRREDTFEKKETEGGGLLVASTCEWKRIDWVGGQIGERMGANWSE